jgi:P-type E1-E2 ATPase
MAGIKTLVIDKTGTLTHGRAQVRRIAASNGYAEADILRLAASVDQASTHVLATALADAAKARDLVLFSPSETVEDPGAGIVGQVDGHSVAIGGRSFVAKFASLEADTDQPRGEFAIAIAVSIDGRFAGQIFMDDPLRAGASETIGDLRRLGIGRVILASGDQKDVVSRIGALLPLNEILGELTPSAKAQLVEARRVDGPLMMVGDGVNDAPALALADVGVAMGARGSAASTEAADAVVLIDDLGPIARGIEIAQRTRRIALQSVWVGLTLSSAAMVVAALGYLPPVQGALLQEAIDVAVIFNALRALR